MKLLLDTHIWVWSIAKPEKLSSAVHRELSDSGNQLWLSPLSIWELLLLVQKNKVQLHRDFGEWVRQSMKDLNLQEAAFTSAVAHELPFIILEQRDPGDRFIVATARVYGLTLVTSDRQILKMNDLQVLANIL